MTRTYLNVKKVERLTEDLKEEKAPGPNGIDVEVVQAIQDEITPSLSKTCIVHCY